MISRRDLLKCAGAALGTLVAADACAAQQPAAMQTSDTRRNIVFILADDLRYDAIAAYGNSFYQTPEMDALARNGMWFDNAFVTTSLCSPSRASILSGQYAHVHQVMNNSTPLPPGTPNFPYELQLAGYETAFVGKWHMGGATDKPRPGFNHWVSFRGQGVYTNPTLNVNGESVKSQGYVTDIITDYAVDYIEQSHDRPFMLYISHKAVHADFQPCPRHHGAYDNRDYPFPATMADTEENCKGKPAWVRAQRDSWHGVDGMYDRKRDLETVVRQTAEAVMALDEGIGRVVRALEARGMLDSTFLVLTSDNGFMFGEHGLIDKRTMYEPSIRVPLVVHCPELVGRGKRRKEMILNIDFAPTFVDVAGRRVPNTMQGTSFLGLLNGTRGDWRQDFLYEYFWERSFPQTPTVLGVRTATHKFMQFHGVWDRYELYDLANDPEEAHNLLGDYAIATEGGSLDHLVATRADDDLKRVYTELQARLKRLLKETRCEPEPDWRP